MIFRRCKIQSLKLTQAPNRKRMWHNSALLSEFNHISLTRQSEHAHFESIARNRISNVSFAVCSAGEIIILAIMVGILKGIKSDESTENNTRAFSVLIAFSGGVWRTSSLHPRDTIIDYCYSIMCSSLVLLGETKIRTGSASWNIITHCRFQANVYCIPRMHAPQANVPLPHILFLDVCPILPITPILSTNSSGHRGDVLNTTV